MHCIVWIVNVCVVYHSEKQRLTLCVCDSRAQGMSLLCCGSTRFKKGYTQPTKMKRRLSHVGTPCPLTTTCSKPSTNNILEVLHHSNVLTPATVLECLINYQNVKCHNCSFVCFICGSGWSSGRHQQGGGGGRLPNYPAGPPITPARAERGSV